jgi:hypothetical protein
MLMKMTKADRICSKFGGRNQKDIISSGRQGNVVTKSYVAKSNLHMQNFDNSIQFTLYFDPKCMYNNLF